MLILIFPLNNISSIIFENLVGFISWIQLDNRWVRCNGLGGISNGMVKIGVVKTKVWFK